MRTMEPKTLNCPICFEGHLERKVKRVTRTYRGHTIEYDQPGEWCDNCGEGILTGADALKNQAQLIAWRDGVDRL
jgi:YgiT-type zinc finger domain-containing protein